MKHDLIWLAICTALGFGIGHVWYTEVVILSTICGFLVGLLTLNVFAGSGGGWY
jgi:hypothetical protein